MRINIGTNKKNLVGIEIKKRFIDITSSDIRDIIVKELGSMDGVSIFGWCPTNQRLVRELNKN